MFLSAVRNTALVCVAAALITTSGCFSLTQDPATTVTISISGVDKKADRDAIAEKLKTMTDGSSHMMSYTSSGDSMNIKLSPVADVQAFSENVTFGKVVSVEGRTVNVEFTGDE